MRFRLAIAASLGLLSSCSVRGADPASAPPAVNPPPSAPKLPALRLKGSFSDGTPLELDALKGRPWVVNLWLPG